MHTRRLLIVAAALSAVVAALTLPAGAGPLDADARITPAATDTVIRSYPTLNADGSPGEPRSWRVSSGSGNCCENYIAATAGGLLVNAGGGIRVSSDAGATWSQVISTRPGSAEGEGAVVAAPGGDVVAVGWAPYDADRLQSYKYDAVTGRWRTSEVPLREPFFDRPWIGVIPGPFTTATGSVPYLTVLRGAYPSKDVWLYSTDGLNYERFGNAGLEAQILGSTVPGPLPVAPNGDLDQIQGHPQSKVTPLASGGLGFGPGCEVARTRADASWDCIAASAEIADASRVLVDSRGWIHAFDVNNSYVMYRVSTDGGATWEADARAYPDGLRGGEFDVKVSAVAGKAALAVHAQGAGFDQDVVLEWDISNPDPTYLGALLLGNGDLDFGSGITETGERFDFQSLTFLPGGKVAVSFGDAEFRAPALAIEL